MRASRKKRNSCRIAGPPHRIRGEKDGEVVQSNLSGAWRAHSFLTLPSFRTIQGKGEKDG
jgi:hypothetical protein